MRMASVFTAHMALAGAAHSSSGVFLPHIEVRDHPTVLLKPITTNEIPRDAGLKGETIHIRMACMDAPEVGERVLNPVLLGINKHIAIVRIVGFYLYRDHSLIDPLNPTPPRCSFSRR